ncbi:MAG TPA: hypothetical protein PLY70_18790, partial [Saprospiraceae bacterium]|nr:hypothetical protein [Saprospiraceae bacterium]
MNLYAQIWKFGLGNTRKRWNRLFRHFMVLFTWKPIIPNSRFWDWPIDLLFYLIDVLYIPELHMTGLKIVKPKMRALTDLEAMLVEEWFGTSIKIPAVMINDKASTFVK